MICIYFDVLYNMKINENDNNHMKFDIVTREEYILYKHNIHIFIYIWNAIIYL